MRGVVHEDHWLFLERGIVRPPALVEQSLEIFDSLKKFVKRNNGDSKQSFAKTPKCSLVKILGELVPTSNHNSAPRFRGR